MALTNHWKQQVLRGNIDHGSDTIKVALGGDNTSYTFDRDNHEFVADVLDGGNTADEISDASYNRQTLQSTTVTQDDADDEGVFDANDVTFSSLSSSQNIQFILLYKQVGGDDSTPGDDPIIAVYDDDSAGSLADLPQTTNGSDIIISFDGEGIINIT